MQTLLRDNPLGIIDIGASGGIHARWKKLTPYYTAILFEPDPREYEQLAKVSPQNHIVLNTALAAKKGPIHLNLCRKQQVSSVFKPNFNLLKRFPEFERFNVESSVCLDADTLDNQLSQHQIDNIDFIKLDTQGYELDILKGSTHTIDQVIGVETEVEFIPMYENQPLFGDMNTFMTDKGFELIDLRRYYMQRDNSKQYSSHHKGQLVFADALYLRPPETLATSKDETKIIHAIMIYFAYGYYDLAETLCTIATALGHLSTKPSQIIQRFLDKQKNGFRLTNFRGKARIKLAFDKMAKTFTPQTWFAGGDQSLGN